MADAPVTPDNNARLTAMANGVLALRPDAPQWEWTANVRGSLHGYLVTVTGSHPDSGRKHARNVVVRPVEAVADSVNVLADMIVRAAERRRIEP